MDIRKIFLKYFKKEGHLILPSSSLIPKNDPSVLLTTAGMQQFKPYYLGTEKPPNPRIATVQKCFRTSDIESVGFTERHLTFFEMLGNFSFGDYFKKETISFSMDFCVNELNIPSEKLMAAVFCGDEDIPADEESIQYWTDNGISKDRVYSFGKEENFWGPAGSTGPCGPCTEIYYDFGPTTGCGRKECDPSCDCGRFLEIWNLVFTQYNYDGKKYAELPNKNIDTGMGLERIATVLEDKTSVFKTSFFKPILDKIYDITGKTLLNPDDEGFDIETNRSIRVLADHARAVYFVLGDGVTPSNEGRGYILRRILRRAIRFGKKLGISDYFLNDIGEIVFKEYSAQYGELLRKKDQSFEIVLDEEKRFTRTLNDGSIILSDMIRDLKKNKKRLLDPKDAFRLYETYGFPIELTTEILKEQEMILDRKKFEKYFKNHVESSKKKTSFDKKVDSNLPVYKKVSKENKTEFLGYEKETLSTSVEGIIRLIEYGTATPTDKLSVGEKGDIILNSTVFYGEKGGQTGDAGIIRSDGGIFIVNDTQIPVEDFIVHKGFIKEGSISCGDKVYIEIDHRKRKDIRKNHTSTHLLHWALRNLLGDQVKQSGSFVTDCRLRFDYSAYNALGRQQLQKIEKMVNEKIQNDDPVRCFETTINYAKEIDSIALFNEKYKKFVRIVEIDDYNRELCGGTHVKRTGEIGLFKIISDSSIGSSLRRIEAATGMYAHQILVDKEERLLNIAGVLETEEANSEEAVRQLKDVNQKLKEELEVLRIETVTFNILKTLKKKNTVEGINLLVFDLKNLKLSSHIPIKDMGTIVDRIKDAYENKNTFIALGNIHKDKPVLILTCTSDLAKVKLNCGKLAKEVGKIIKGGGGGRPSFAQLGGTDGDSLSKALDFIVKTVKKSLGS